MFLLNRIVISTFRKPHSISAIVSDMLTKILCYVAIIFLYPFHSIKLNLFSSYYELYPLLVSVGMGENKTGTNFAQTL